MEHPLKLIRQTDGVYIKTKQGLEVKITGTLAITACTALVLVGVAIAAFG